MLYNNWLAANMMDEGKIVNFHKSKITITLYSKHPYKNDSSNTEQERWLAPSGRFV